MMPEGQAWSVRVVEANGARPIDLYKVPRSVAEATVIGFLFDTLGGIGMSSTNDLNGYPRIAVWSQPWTV